MKKIIPIIICVLLSACTRESLNAPKYERNIVANNHAVTYKDNSISIVDFKAQSNNKSIEITFTTLYEKNIVKPEILKGLTSKNLCSIYQQAVNSNSDAVNRYSTSDTNEDNAAAIYYMVKYTLANGDWGYTPVFKLTL